MMVRQSLEEPLLVDVDPGGTCDSDAELGNSLHHLLHESFGSHSCNALTMSIPHRMQGLLDIRGTLSAPSVVLAYKLTHQSDFP